MTDVETLLLTRPAAQSRALAIDIEDRFSGKATCLISPLLEIETTGTLPDLTKFQTIIFTSVNGIKAFVDLGAKHPHCICVGERTAKAARAHGFTALSADGAAAELIALAIDNLSPTAGPLLHVRGAHTAGDIATQLRNHGFTIEETVLYQQHALTLNQPAQHAFTSNEITAIPLYSPRSARLLLEQIIANPAWQRDRITALCISPNVSAELATSGFRTVKTASAPTGAAMLTLIGHFLG